MFDRALNTSMETITLYLRSICTYNLIVSLSFNHTLNLQFFHYHCLILGFPTAIKSDNCISLSSCPENSDSSKPQGK